MKVHPGGTRVTPKVGLAAIACLPTLGSGLKGLVQAVKLFDLLEKECGMHGKSLYRHIAEFITNLGLRKGDLKGSTGGNHKVIEHLKKEQLGG